MSKNKYLDLIKQQRKEKVRKKFEGTFIDYLDLLEENPEVCDLAHRRLYKSIMDKGSRKVEDSDPR